MGILSIVRVIMMSNSTENSPTNFGLIIEINSSFNSYYVVYQLNLDRYRRAYSEVRVDRRRYEYRERNRSRRSSSRGRRRDRSRDRSRNRSRDRSRDRRRH